jgi:hypothetical protein
VPTFYGYRVSHGQRNGFPWSLISVFSRPEPLLFLQELLSCPHEAEWTPFQTRSFSENLEAPGIEPGTFGFAARNSDHMTTEVKQSNISYVGFEILTAVVMKSSVFWDITL